MAKEPQTEPRDPIRPKPIDDPLAQAIDKFSNEVEPILTTPDAGETPTSSEGDPGPTA